MILTITYNRKPATDLGYLLYKNPNRPQTFDLNFGKAHVFYPEVSEEICTLALLLEIDTIELTRGKKGSNGLFDYVNDRPYVSSSFLSVAMSKVFGTAMSGKSKERPELVDELLPFMVQVVMVPCNGNENIIYRLFEPLGYKVSLESYNLDDNFTEWGKSNYYTITLEGNVKVQDLLNHIYVLIPVLDADKHYWVGEDEVEKLLRHGGNWLSIHPDVELITSRYLKKRRNLINVALNQLLENEEESELVVKEKIINLNEQRLEAVATYVKKFNPKKVIDIGCGEGNLLKLVIDSNIETLTGVDVSYSELEKAKLKVERLPEYLSKKINLFQGSLTYKDDRFYGYDVATIIEVIEHLDINRLKAFERIIFEYAKPKTIILTTPNKEYNNLYKNLSEEELRHNDHRFEWTRSEFQKWANEIAYKFGYKVEFVSIGDEYPQFGSPTQMGVFTR